MNRIVFKLTFLFLPFLSFGQDQRPIRFFALENEWSYCLVASDYKMQYLHFMDSCGQLVRLTRGQSSVVDSTGYEIISEVINAISRQNQDQIDLIKWKVWFYEQHFGVLNGNKTDKCVDYQPNPKPEPLTKCLIKE